MKVPILKQGTYLIASVQSALTDTDLLDLREDLVDQAGRFRSRGVIIDLTVLDVMDSFACRTLRGIAQMVRLRGADTAIIGIQPEVAFSMVQLGLNLEGAITALDLDDGMAQLRSLHRKRGAQTEPRHTTEREPTPTNLPEDPRDGQ